MRRAIARARMLPQSLSTDPRYGRLSLKAQVLYPLMWVNCDDQGRITGDPAEIKYATCPNVDHISKSDVPELLKELDTEKFIQLYNTSRTEAVQMLDWWEEQRLQWAWPSRYPPPTGWQDRLRYKPNPKEIITENWLPPSQLASPPPSPLQSDRESTKEIIEKEGEEGKRKGRGNIPGRPGSTSPSLTGSSLFQLVTDTFYKAWGRMPDSRETAQLRDFSEEISSAGGATAAQVYDAFKEASGQSKLHISYVRAVLFNWLGLERGPPR